MQREPTNPPSTEATAPPQRDPRAPPGDLRLPPDACPSIESCCDETCCYLDWLIGHRDEKGL
jgi:hypothetical protein